jgi:hypothetical protein
MIVLRQWRSWMHRGKQYSVTVQVDDKHLMDMVHQTLDEVPRQDPARHYAKHFGSIVVRIARGK